MTLMGAWTCIDLPSDPKTWPSYRKTATIHALRMDGPFKVQTPEGERSCPDGYLVVDNRGFPFCLGVADFEKLYVALD